MREEFEPGKEEATQRPPIAPKVMEVSVRPTEALILPPASVTDLIRCIEGGIARNRRRSRTVRVFNHIYGFGWMAALYWSSLHNFAHIEWLVCLSAVSCLLRRATVDVVLSVWARRSRGKEHNAARQLIASEDAEAVGTLIDLLEWTDYKDLEPELWRALGRLLPRLTASEAQELGKERHGALAAWMKSWDYRSAESNVPLLGMIHVMGYLGRSSLKTTNRYGERSTVSLLPLLKKWAAGKGSGQDPAVQEAAIACREAVERKIALTHSGEQLLRASTPPVAGVESLLRPAQGTAPTPAQELLRPGDPQ
jgi:hypothetical protein